MHLCRKFSAVALLCAMLTYPFGQRRPNGNGFHVRSHSLIGDAERESAFHQGPYLLFHPPPSPSFTHLQLSLFLLSFNLCLLSPFLLLSYFIFHSLSLFLHPQSPCCLFLLLASLHLFPSLLPSHIPSIFPSSFIVRLLSNYLLFIPHVDVFAIGDPNQSTILAVSIAGGIVLLIFLVTCFVVSGR